MKNFGETRSKIKNYLNALNERFSTNEWNEYRSNNICREFGVSIILPQILKEEGFYYYQHKDGVPFIMLSHKIGNLNESILHNKLLEFSRNSYKKKKQKEEQNQIGYKNLTIQVSMEFYKKILIDCEKRNISVTQWLSSKLVSDNEFSIDYIKPAKKLGRPPMDYVKPAKKLGRPPLKKTGWFSDFDKNKIVERLKNKEKVKIKTIEPVESAETKIKSLETIMSLFTNGVINQQELESLKKGVLTK